MGVLVEEVRRWNTPLIGAYLLWRFTDGYTKFHPNGEAPVGLLHFIAMPILMNVNLSEPISGKRLGLSSYSLHFEKQKTLDLLLSLQDRIISYKHFSLSAIDVAVAQGLLVWDTKNGKIYSRPLERKVGRGMALRRSVKQQGAKAEVLGKWFSCHSLAEISTFLKVAF